MKTLSTYLILFITLFSACSTEPIEPSIFSREINSNWKFSEADKDEWLSASVPGCVHSDLLQHDKIDDPFYRLNEHDVQWIDKKDWVYKTNIEVSKEELGRNRVELEFKGLDTHADVYLNNTKILVADNMFRGWRVDVKKQLKKGSNELKIYFHSPIKVGLEKYDNYPHVVQSSANDLAEIGQVEGNKWVSPHLRKPGYHFGWDWGPRLVTSGIWEPVYLNSWNLAKINDLHVIQNKIETEKAQLTAEFEIEAERARHAELVIYVNNSTAATSKVKLKSGIHKYSIGFEIEKPNLWWTNGLGEAHMYKVAGELITKAGSSKKEHNIGLRTVELVREDDEIGKSFYFKLNGYPVFMKGANYIPNDVFLDRVTPEKYEEVILRAKDCHMNMLRVWGGGIYEKDIFYDLCDKHGLLVWQDFMFACNMYPGHEEYLESVKEEAVYNIKRLRNHPSIAMWCGNNEILSAWFGWGWKRSNTNKDPKGAEAQWKAYKDIFLNVLNNAVEENDPQRFYWPSSPQTSDTIKSGLTHGDSHYWSVWGGASSPFESYRKNISRFMSEYGFQAFPDLSSIKKYTIEEDWDIYSEVMKSHQRSYVGNKQIAKYMERDYRNPKDFESLLYVGQVLQAEGIRLAMESHRVAMPGNMGSLYWQLNDCWPVASWSGTDYYGKWKALQYFIKKSFEEVIIVPSIDNDNIDIHIVSDRLKSFEGNIKLTLTDFKGIVLWENNIDEKIKANSSNIYFTEPVSELLSSNSYKNAVLTATVYENNKAIASNKFYFKPVKDLELPKVNINFEVLKHEGKYIVKLNTDNLAKNVYLSVEGYDGNYSDNFFDLLPGEEKSVEFESSQSMEEVQNSITIRTIRDTY